MSTPGGTPPQDPPSWPGRPAEELDAEATASPTTPSGAAHPEETGRPQTGPHKPPSGYPAPPPAAWPPPPPSWSGPPQPPSGQYPVASGYGSPPGPPPASAPPGTNWGYQGAGVFGYGPGEPPAYPGGSPPGYPAGGWQPVAPPPAKKRRTPLIVGLVALLVVALGVGGFVLLNGNNKPTFTYNGKSISNADTVLQESEKQVNDQVSTRHGAKTGDTRCYFAVPKTPASGAKKTDISPQLLCGPVLFVDGDAKQAYLAYDVNQTSSENGKVVLAVSDAPQSPNPTSLPQSVNLRRPDGASPPSGSGGLKPPPPPAAEQDALVVAEVDQSKLTKAPASAVMVGDTYGVRLTATGAVDRYGNGDGARVAASGSELLAFTFTIVSGVTSETAQSHQLTIQVGSSPARPLPGRTPAVVVSTPTGQPVKLIMVDKGVRQELSLPAGKPGPENILINVRQHRSATVSRSGSFRMNLRDGAATGSFSGRYSVSRAGLYGTVNGRRPSSPRDCFFAMGLTYKRVGAIRGPFTSTGTGPFTFRGPLLHVTVNGRRHAAIQSGSYTYFQIPATATSVTVTISGKAAVGNGITESVATPVTFHITFKSG
jgi:hypothetical protein